MVTRPRTPSVSTSTHPVDLRAPRLHPPYNGPPDLLRSLFCGVLIIHLLRTKALVLDTNAAPGQQKQCAHGIYPPAEPTALFGLQINGGKARWALPHFSPHRRFRTSMIAHGAGPRVLLNRSALGIGSRTIQPTRMSEVTPVLRRGITAEPGGYDARDDQRSETHPRILGIHKGLVRSPRKTART
jgi:hypothetical protein